MHLSDSMKRQNMYAVIGLRALQRAALKVAEDARKNNYKIPIWENDHIKYEIPEDAGFQYISDNSASDVLSNVRQEVGQ